MQWTHKLSGFEFSIGNISLCNIASRFQHSTPACLISWDGWMLEYHISSKECHWWPWWVDPFTSLQCFCMHVQDCCHACTDWPPLIIIITAYHIISITRNIKRGPAFALLLWLKHTGALKYLEGLDKMLCCVCLLAFQLVSTIEDTELKVGRPFGTGTLWAECYPFIGNANTIRLSGISVQHFV